MCIYLFWDGFIGWLLAICVEGPPRSVADDLIGLIESLLARWFEEPPMSITNMGGSNGDEEDGDEEDGDEGDGDEGDGDEGDGDEE